jgi:hypothetical protein
MLYVLVPSLKKYVEISASLATFKRDMSNSLSISKEVCVLPHFKGDMCKRCHISKEVCIATFQKRYVKIKSNSWSHFN